MTTVEKILKVVRERGLTIRIKDGQSVISGDVERITPTLRQALTEFREQILDYLKLDHRKTRPAGEPDFKRTVFVIDAFGQIAMVVSAENWKNGRVAWQYHGDDGWRPIVGKEDVFPSSVKRGGTS